MCKHNFLLTVLNMQNTNFSDAKTKATFCDHVYVEKAGKSDDVLGSTLRMENNTTEPTDVEEVLHTVRPCAEQPPQHRVATTRPGCLGKLFKLSMRVGAIMKVTHIDNRR